jgi:hypothetical protein
MNKKKVFGGASFLGSKNTRVMIKILSQLMHLKNNTFQPEFYESTVRDLSRRH